jgi:MFS family permease
VDEKAGLPAAGRGRARSLSLRTPRTFDSLKEREFRWFYVSMLGQMAAMNMQLVVRGYLAYVLTGSFAALGLVGLAGALPMLFLSPFGGVVADRVPKRTVIQVGQALGLINALAVAALVFLEFVRIEWLFVSAVMHGIVMALMMPARQSMVHDLVGKERLTNAVALNMAGMNSMRLFSPALGGVLVSLVGFGWAFLAMGVLYVFALAALQRVTWTPASAPGAVGASYLEVGRSAVADIAGGFRYVVRDRLMFTVLAFSFVSSLFAMPYLFLLPGYVSAVFNGGGAEAGLLVSISAAGSLAGALVLASLPERRRGLTMLISSAVIGVGLVAFAGTTSYWVASVFIIVVGVGSALRQALTQALLHSFVENAYRGRVMALFMMQFGTFFVGLLAEVVGIRWAFAGLGIGLVAVSMLAGIAVPRLRKTQ